MKSRSSVYFPTGGSLNSAYALINRRWMDGLESTGRFVVSTGDERPARPDYVIHHNFESNFREFEGPPGAVCILVRPWDFGPYPPAWVEAIHARFEQLWVPSRWSAHHAVAGGVDPDRVRVIPLGVDELIYRPEGDRSDLPTRASFRFLFVGGVSVRKGSDILLAAYRQAFSAGDDVCLVIKDHSGDVFYRRETIRSQVRHQASDPEAPEILFVDEFLPEHRLAALVRACDAGVFPYRAEGFCLPILEMMASGIPSIVPDFGACLDFCSDTTSFLTPARRVSLPVSGGFTFGLGFTEIVDEVDFCEMSIDELASQLRRVREADPVELESKARAGVRVAHSTFTWKHSVDAVLSNLASAGMRPRSARPSSPS